MHDTHFEVSVCGRPSSIIRAASMFHWIHTQRARMGGGGEKRAFHCVHSNAGGKGGDGKRTDSCRLKERNTIITLAEKRGF